MALLIFAVSESRPSLSLITCTKFLPEAAAFVDQVLEHQFYVYKMIF